MNALASVKTRRSSRSSMCRRASGSRRCRGQRRDTRIDEMQSSKLPEQDPCQRPEIGDVLRDLDRAAVEVAVAIQRGAPSGQHAHRRNAVVPRARRFVLGMPARTFDLLQVGDVGADLLRAAAKSRMHEDDDALIDRRWTERFVRLAGGQQERQRPEGKGPNSGFHNASAQVRRRRLRIRLFQGC